jgi:hypothetical protein
MRNEGRSQQAWIIALTGHAERAGGGDLAASMGIC